MREAGSRVGLLRAERSFDFGGRRRGHRRGSAEESGEGELRERRQDRRRSKRRRRQELGSRTRLGVKDQRTQLRIRGGRVGREEEWGLEDGVDRKLGLPFLVEVHGGPRTLKVRTSEIFFWARSRSELFVHGSLPPTNGTARHGGDRRKRIFPEELDSAAESRCRFLCAGRRLSTVRGIAEEAANCKHFVLQLDNPCWD